MPQLDLDIRGMHCPACERHVREALQGVEGVLGVDLPGWESARATVQALESTEARELEEAVARAGYQAEVRGRVGVELTKRENRESADGFDLMVIGGGSAGFAAAIRGAELGARVALVESDTIGGTCVNWGCVPSKNLLRAVEFHHLARRPRFAGVATHAEELDWPAVISQKAQLVEEMQKARYLDVLEAYPQIRHLRGRAELIGGGRVSIAGEVHSPGKIVIATGSQPWSPPIPGLADSGYLDSAAALDLREIPDSLIVLGGNSVGLEIAQIYARAGSSVTVVELADRIAPLEEPGLSQALAGYLEEEGLRLLAGTATEGVQHSDGEFRLRATRAGRPLDLRAAQLLVATGRRPNTHGLGLEAAGVRLGKRGEILANRQLQTDHPDIYAAGDVLGGDMFVYVAAQQGNLAADNALTSRGRVYDGAYLPRVTFTDPQIATAGLTEQQARERGLEIKTTQIDMDLVAAAQARRDTRGLIKLVARADNDRLVGAHILAPEAGEMIQIAVLAIRFGIPLGELRQTLFPYLTNGEGLKLAALSFEKDLALLSCCAV